MYKFENSFKRLEIPRWNKQTVRKESNFITNVWNNFTEGGGGKVLF